MTRQTSDILALLRDNYFTFGVFVCIILAELAPWIGAKEGPLIPEITVKYFAVFIIFFSSGLTIKWKELSQALKQCQLHIFIQAISFLYIPVFVQVFLFALEYVFDLDSWIHKGFVIVSCMPPPVSSAVILVKSIGGNEAVAIFNSALGSVLGILLTPMLLLYHTCLKILKIWFYVVGISSSMPILKTALQLVQTMIFPIILGQFFQKAFSSETLASIPFSAFGQISLLYIIYTSFCDMFAQEDFNVDTHLILVTILFVVIIQIVLVFSVFQVTLFLSKKSNMFKPQDVIATTFCSTHKSLTLGMPLLKVLYGGYSHLSQISLPLLIYHPVQLILGGFLVPYCRKWLKRHLNTSSSFKRP